MQPEEITNYIVKELGKQHNPEDIAMALCEKTSMTWSEAQQLCQEVARPASTQSFQGMVNSCISPSSDFDVILLATIQRMFQLANQ